MNNRSCTVMALADLGPPLLYFLTRFSYSIKQSAYITSLGRHGGRPDGIHRSGGPGTVAVFDIIKQALVMACVRFFVTTGIPAKYRPSFSPVKGFSKNPFLYKSFVRAVVCLRLRRQPGEAFSERSGISW